MKNKKFIAIITSVMCCACQFSVVNMTDISVFAESADNGYELVTNGTKQMTLSDVAELAKKGTELSWADFGPYEAQWSDTGAFCTCFITLEDGFCLSVGGNPAEPPTIVWFYKDKAINGFIDIRKDDIEAFIQEMTNNKEHSGKADAPSSYQLPEIEYTFEDIFAMTTEEVLALFAEKGLTQEKGYYVYGQGDDAEYVFPHLWEVLIFSDAYLSDQTVEELLKKYPPMDNGNQLYCSGNSIWNEQMIKSSLALPEEYFDYNVFEDRLYVNEKGSTKKSSIACDCIIRCKLTDKKEYAAVRNAALNYLQLRPDFDSFRIDGDIPYYGKEKSTAQKTAEAVSDYMENNSVHGIVFYSDERVGIGYPEEYDTQIRAYVTQLNTEGVTIDFGPHGTGYDFSGTLTIDDYATGINYYMFRNSPYGCAEVYEENGVKKIRVVAQSRDDYTQMTEYISGLGIDGNLIQCLDLSMTGFNFDDSTQIQKGDANDNNLIDAVDASIILANYAKYSTSSDKPSVSELSAQDINNDGLINAVDASMVLAYYAYVSVGGNLSFSEYLNNSEKTVKTTNEWNGKPVSSELYTVLSKNTDEKTVIAVSPRFNSTEQYKYNGKTMAEYLEEISYSNLLNEKLHQILLDGDKLKYGEILYTTGTPNGIRWSKELYEQKREFYGEKFLAKYIVNGEFLKDLVEADIADFSTEPYTALTDANNAYQAYKKVIIQEAIEQLKQQNIKYDYNEEYNDLIINITAEEFKGLSLENVSCYYIASTYDDDGYVSTKEGL